MSSTADFLLPPIPEFLYPPVKIYTDGACSGNPGPGGWGALLCFPDGEREISGAEENTTNNRMELTAAIRALSYLQRPSSVDLITDSTYLRDGITSWLSKWKENGWRNAQKKPVKNKDLWEELDNLLPHHRIEWHWVRGHEGNVGNERADKLATEAIKKMRGEPV